MLVSSAMTSCLDASCSSPATCCPSPRRSNCFQCWRQRSSSERSSTMTVISRTVLLWTFCSKRRVRRVPNCFCLAFVAVVVQFSIFFCTCDKLLSFFITNYCEVQYCSQYNFTKKTRRFSGGGLPDIYFLGRNRGVSFARRHLIGVWLHISGLISRPHWVGDIRVLTLHPITRHKLMITRREWKHAAVVEA